MMSNALGCSQKSRDSERFAVITVTLPQPMLAALDREAKRLQLLNRSALLRMAIQHYLEKVGVMNADANVT